jgi:hypothetical protein
MMGNVLKGIKRCIVFIDDIIIFSETWEEHQLILYLVVFALQG